MTISKEVQGAINELSMNIEKLRGTTQSVKRGKEKLRSNLEAIRELLETGMPAKSAEPDSDQPQAKSIEEFFSAVGTGVREAQDSLDQQSLQYIKNRPSFAPETMFRVPKVSANLKLGMTLTEGKKIDFLVIGKSSESSRTIEQEINFDIVSAPLPPDALEGFAELPIDPILVTNTIEREEVKARLLQEKKGGTHEGKDVGKLINKILLKDAFRRVLVIRGEGNWTLMLVEPLKKRESEQKTASLNAEVLVLPVDQDKDAPKELIANRRMAHFYGLLFPIADKQNKLLTDLGRT